MKLCLYFMAKETEAGTMGYNGGDAGEWSEVDCTKHVFGPAQKSHLEHSTKEMLGGTRLAGCKRGLYKHDVIMTSN